MRGVAGLVLLLVVACGRDRLHGVEGGVQVTAAELAFPRTFVGYASTQTLELTNSAPASRTVTLTASEPYSVPQSIIVEAGSKLAVPVRFSPASAGLQPSTLAVLTDGRSMSVTLMGEGVQVPACATGSTCSPVHFDPNTGTCVTAAADDGTLCSDDACLVNASCRAGVCVGEPRTCDDGNACTADSCDPTRGCVHVDEAASCPAPTDPCKVPTCSASGGCGQTDAPDGTVCGSVSCAQAHVCIVGSCRAVTPPDGFECAPASPCQAHGTCQQGQCARPPATVLQPEWTYDLDTNGSDQRLIVVSQNLGTALRQFFSDLSPAPG
jgi:hypothetical protein